MLTGLLDSATPMHRSRVLRAGLGVVIAVQLAAFWMLCNSQMEKAQARQTEIQVHRMAMADCLRYIPHATIASCNGSILRADAPATAVLGAAPTTVSFRR